MFENHADMVSKLAKPGEEILTTLNPEKAHLLHMIMGMAGEVGELLDAIKKHVAYDKPLDVENVIEELGDIEFYTEGLRQGLQITRDQVIETNIAKLSKRYHKGSFSNDQANERADKVTDLIDKTHIIRMEYNHLTQIIDVEINKDGFSHVFEVQHFSTEEIDVIDVLVSVNEEYARMKAES